MLGCEFHSHYCLLISGVRENASGHETHFAYRMCNANHTLWKEILIVTRDRAMRFQMQLAQSQFSQHVPCAFSRGLP